MARSVRAGDGIESLWVLIAIGLLVINDHWAKHAHPSPLTGKLSDVAGLFFFPLLLEAATELTQALWKRAFRPSRSTLIAVVLSTGLVFAAAKTWEPMNHMIRMGDGCVRWPMMAVAETFGGRRLPRVALPNMVMDRTDLWALPTLGLSLFCGLRRHRRALAIERSKARGRSSP